MNAKQIKAGGLVTIKSEFQDYGDSNFVWVATEDQDGNRVRIQPQIPSMSILPTYVVTEDMLD